MDVIRTLYDKETMIGRLSQHYPRSTYNSVEMKIYTCVVPFRANYMLMPLEINVYFDSFEQGTDVTFCVKPLWWQRAVVLFLTIMALYYWAAWINGAVNFLFTTFSSLFPIVMYLNQRWQIRECKSRFIKFINGLA